MKIFTIGFTKTSAENFFQRLKDASVQRLLDVRLNNVSQLSGFAKKDDLRFFVNSICGIDYEHRLDLAPTSDMLNEYKQNQVSWTIYEKKFLELIKSRRIHENIPREIMDGACLLCSEQKPQHCHRRLVAEYLVQKWGDVEVKHL